MKDELLEDAMAFAYYAHLGQYRRCNPEKTNLYVSHPLTVMDLVKKFGGTKEDMVVACLHDVLEDCKDKGYDYSLIKSKFGQKIADRVLNLTNKKVDPKTGEKLSQNDWKMRKRDIQIEEIKKMSPEDQLVKACDQLHNMSDYKEYSAKNIVHREDYIQKGYDLIRACSGLPLELKVYARTLYNEAKDFFAQNSNIEYASDVKFTQFHNGNIYKKSYSYANS